ncbi:DUF805 domain-containing protein [Novosphingobium album (ex Hu et al. 2023)]|uniref:DUF805 domain-containing protein n=1 Tax=Novosphingobium album (ex Hu et al. 2023) TaxID=2930093 RepID=A0ABT0AYB7_9SPHN|nr:DUF805 domain-containing protein [Novosphingobium album (ex Hu et al. 2023)]MCJ2177714.1 DUF805 domain-containing protein [Novosphingobium album (ex Hu et al. 2023)]
MIEAIRHNLSSLTNFSGRDSRSTFWFYVLFLAIIQLVTTFGVSIVAGGAMAVDVFQSARGGADQAAIQQQMIERMAGLIQLTMWMSVVLSIVMTLLLAAAFARRLHDSGNSGWIAALAVVLQLLSIVLTIGMIGEMVSFITSMKLNDPSAMQAAAQMQRSKYALQGLLGWVPLLIVIIFGVWPSSDGDNRYGPEPDHL